MIAYAKRNLLSWALWENSLVVLGGNMELRRNGDVMFPFRQDSDFLLLTGVSSPDCTLVGYKEAWVTRWIIFSNPISEKELIWGTSRMSQEEIRARSHIEEIYPMDQMKSIVLPILEDAETILIRKDKYRCFPHEKQILRKLWMSAHKEKITVLEPYLDRIRIIKSPEEIEKIRNAITVTHKAHEIIQSTIKPGMYEYEIEPLVASLYRSHYLTEAYPTIVASGPNACTLHYTRHNRKIENGDFVLVDFGAEYQWYAADITRVFPVGEISDRQKEVYQSVVIVKNYAESIIRPGIKKSDYEKLVRENMNEELWKLWLIPSDTTKWEIQLLSRKYYPHSTSHFLGLDVHDVGSREQIFEAGMVITCEPGIYIPEEGIGVRLEDDILITENGCENLSKGISMEY
jgi:Xaa-Pro aminopeptidase